MKITAKRFFTRCAVFAALLMCLFACCATAGAEEVYTDHAELLRDGFLPAKQPMDIIVLRGESFEEFMISQFEARATEFSALNYELTPDEFRQAYTDVLDKHPELFYAPNSWSYTTSGDYVATVWVEYTLTEAEIASKTAAFNASVQEVVRYAAQADTTLGKIMMVHDYLCASYEYDTTLVIHSAEEMFRLGTGVCQAYLQCFQAVMNELGIACEPVTSESMNHGWNMVQLDGSWYHLDATWDDPTSDMPLRARHQYFLLSNAGIEANEHTGWTCAQSATSTKYDSFFWANVNNPIPVVGDAMYYAEMNTTDYTRTLKKWDMSANTTTDVHTYSIASAAGRIRYVNGYNPMAASDSHLYYATVDKVYGLPIEGGTPELMHTFTGDECVWLSWFDGADVQVFASDNINTATEPVKLQDLGYVSPFTYTDNGDGTCTITGYTGSDSDIVVPETINGLTVTTIGPNAFYFEVWDDAAGDMVSTLEVTSIQLPSTLTTLEWMAINSCEMTEITLPASLTSFVGNSIMDCQKLSSVTVEAGNTAYTAVNNAVYTADMSTLVFCPIGADNGSFAVPEGVTTIGKWAFSYNKDLASVTLPEGLQELQINAFYNCSALASINLPSTLTTLGDSAFENTGLTSVVIPEGVTALSNYLFMGCASLTEVVLPDGIESVGAMPFECCPAVIYCNNGTTAAATLDAAGIAHQEQVHFTYTDNGDGTCTITGYTGTDTELEIPSSINGLTVTAIGEAAFKSQNALTAVTIPEGVVSIGIDAFRGCTNVVVINLPETLASIGTNAFYQCSSVEQVFVPTLESWLGIEFVNTHAQPLNSVYDAQLFIGGEALTEVVIPEGTTAIGAFQFQHCVTLESVTIPDSVTSIGEGAFARCYAMTQIDLPDELTTIDYHAFYVCKNLQSIEIPAKVISIGRQAFELCGALQSLTLPDGPLEIGSSAFMSCSKLTTISVPSLEGWLSTTINTKFPSAYQLYVDGELLTHVDIPEGTATIASYQFANCASLQSIDLPQSVSDIESCAFLGCTGLAAVELPEAVTDIQMYTFEGCTSLKTVSLGEKVTEISAYAFQKCSSLQNLVIPDSLYYIGDYAFYKCSALESVRMSSRVVSIGKYAFNGCAALTAITLPETITQLKTGMFSQCTSLVDVTLPDNLTSLPDEAFYSCSSLETIELPENLTSVSKMMFYGCTQLKQITLPAGVTTIGNSAFNNCSSLERINLPEAITSIGTNVFNNCTNLTAEVVEGSYAHTWCVDNGVAFELVSPYTYTDNGDGTCTITGYTGTDTELEIPSSINGLTVTAIGEGAFFTMTDTITSVVIPDTVTTIGNDAFMKCFGLASITIPDSVTSIGEGAFAYTALTSVELPDGLTEIAGTMFTGSALESIAVPDSVTTIGWDAFSQCESLVSVELPEGLTTISNGAFYQCCELASINIPSAVTTIDAHAFEGCSVLTALDLPDSITVIGEEAFDADTLLCANAGSTTATTLTAAGWSFQSPENSAYSLKQYVDENGELYLTIHRYTLSESGVTIPGNIQDVPVKGLSDNAIYGPDVSAPISLPDNLVYFNKEAFASCQYATLFCSAGSTTATNLTNVGLSFRPIPPAEHPEYVDFLLKQYEDENGELYLTIHRYTLSESGVTIPGNIQDVPVKGLSDNAIYGPELSASISLPDNLVYFNKEAFASCQYATLFCSVGSATATNLTNVGLSFRPIPPAEHPEYVDFLLKQYEDENGELYLTIHRYTLSESGVTIPGNIQDVPVKGLSDNAIYGPELSASISLPDNLVYFNKEAFASCQYATLFCSVGSATATNLTNVGLSFRPIPPAEHPEYVDFLLKQYEDENGALYLMISYYRLNSDVTIPSSIQGVPVRGLCANAFYGPDSTATITLPNLLMYIDEAAFDSCPNATLQCDAGSVTATVISTYGHSFAVSGYEGLRFSQSIDSEADTYRPILTVTGYVGSAAEVEVPGTVIATEVVAIGEGAFQNNETLTSVSIGEGVVTIGENAFNDCSGIRKISLPTTIQSIGRDAFYGCSGVKEVYIPTLESWVGIEYANDMAHPMCIPYTAKLYVGGELLKEAVIPEGITSIGDFQFLQCSALESVTIPSSVKTIGENAFGMCTSLKEVNLSEGLESIDLLAFCSCEALKSVVIPEGVVIIGDYAFSYCTGLTSIILPASVESMGTYTLRDSSRVTATVVENSYAHNWCLNSNVAVKVVSDPTNFSYTDNGDGTCTITGYTGDATELVIPAAIDGLKVTAIGEEAFVDLVDITSVTLPEGLETIGVMAFGYCEKLMAIHVPASVTSIQHHAFSPYSGIQNITVDENNPNYASVDGVLFSKDLSTLLRYPAARPNDSYTVPAGTTVIGNWAFNMSQSLRQVILPEGVTTLSDCAFGYAVGLELVNLPASISFIDPDAFFGCGNVMCQVEPDSYAHLWCHLNDVETDQAAIPFEIADNGDGTCTIVRCLSKAEHVDVPATICGLKVIALGEESFMDRTNMVSISLPEGLEVIGSWAFEMAENLRTIHIPSTVREIGTNAFAHYSGLTSITVEPGSAYFTSVDGVLFTADMSTLVRYPASKVGYSYTAPEGVTTVQERAFNGSALLNEIYLPDSVTTIGERAFDNCVSLMYVSLPGNVSFIGEGALANCGNVTAGVVEGSYAHQWCIDNEIWWSLLQNKYGEYAYHDNGDGTCLITGYSGSDSHVDVPAEINGLKVVGLAEFAFDMAPMTSITLPEGLKTIDELAFCFCENLTEITVPASVTHVAARAFSPYSGVQNIYVADGSQSYASVDGVLFTKDMSKLVRYPAARTEDSYTVPAGVKVIGPESMHLSYALDTIVLPEGVTTIDQCAFAYCVSLDSINLPASITSIADYAFDNCGNVVATVVDGSYAHNWCVENDVAVNVLPAPSTLYAYTDNGDGTCTITGYTGEETELVIPAELDGLKVTAIGRNAFYDNDQLTSVVIPEDVTSIGVEAFWSCGSLQNVSLPSTLESIDVYAFTFCFNIAELTIPAATTSIAEAAFASMPTVMTVESGNTAYKMVDDVLYTIDGKTLLFCPNFKTGVFEVPEGTERIGEMAFWGTDVTEIHISASVAQISFHAFGETYFMECFVVDDASQHFADVDGMLLTKDGTQLYCVPQTFGGSLIVPDGVKIIKSEAVRNYNITNVVLPEGITTLEGGAFLNLPLETASLPLSLTDIHDNAFANCGDFTATVYDGSVAHIWCVENGIAVNVLENPLAGMVIPMDMSRLEVGPTVPTGLPFTVQTADGSLQITYDGENANWDDVATYAYLEEGKVSQPVRIEVASVNAAEVRLICGQWETDEEILTALDAAEAYELVDDTLYHWIPYAEVDTANGTVTPISTDCTVAIQYRNTDGTVLYNEKFDLDVSCTTQGTFPATVNWIDMTTATPNYHGLEGIISRVEGNTLIYTLPAGFRELVATAFPVPEGTEGFSLDHLWMTGLWELRDGMARWAYNLDVLPVTYETPVAFYDANGSFLGGGRVRVRFEEEQAVQPVPVSRIRMEAIPYGMAMDLSVTDGNIYAYIDDEATDWNKVLTFNDPLYLHNPSTGESWYATDKVNFGFTFDNPEGAAYSKSVVGNVWESDEEILSALRTTTDIWDLTTSGHGWWHEIAIYDAENKQFELQEIVGGNPHNYTYAVLWLDEHQNELYAEKIEVCYDHSNPDVAYPASPVQIPAEDILPNTTGVSYADYTVSDGLLELTFTNRWPDIFTLVEAPEGTASYSMCDEGFDPDAERYELVEGRYVGYELSGWPEGQTESSYKTLHCWYDAEGNLIGGGWCTFHYTKAEAQLPAFKLPAAMRQIEAEAFLNASVQNVILPDGCESIGDRAFAGCNLLQEITIPASVTSIADDAFDGCDEMTITAEDGSYAEIYAEEHGIACFTR